MGIIGDAVGIGLGAVGSIFGGISASKAMKKVKDNLNNQKSDNLNWYNRRYNEDATQRADAQAMLTKTEETIRSRNRAARGAQAVMGGTDESVAAEKAANSHVLADAAAQIVVNGERRKDAIESQYQAKDEALQQQLNDMEINRAHNTSQAIKGVTDAGANIAKLFSDGDVR